MNIEALIILGMFLIVVGQLVTIWRLQHKVDLHKERASVFIGRWQSAMSAGLKERERRDSSNPLGQYCGCGDVATTVDRYGYAQCDTCRGLDRKRIPVESVSRHIF